MRRGNRRTGGSAALARPGGAGILRLYPASWRRRYEPEMLAMLEQLRLDPQARLDLIRGAIDARLHSSSRSAAVAALVAGALWTVAGAGIAAQPVPPDWPGYLLETLPFATVATALAALATIGCWARGSDAAGRIGQIAIVLALIGQVAWIAALGSVWLGAAIGSATILAEVPGALGPALIGLLLIRSGDVRIGVVLVGAPATMLLGSPLAWLGFGFAWTLIGVLLLAAPDPEESLPMRFA